MQRRTPLRGIIFDLDGTLANTLPVCYVAFRHAYRKFTGRHYTDAEIAALFGPSEEGSLHQVIPERWEEGLQVFLEEYERAHALCTSPFTGVIGLLDYLREQNIR